MELDFQTGALLLLIAAVVAMLTRRLRLPYSVGLVAAGIILAILPFAPKVALTKDLIFIALLPPLLFEAAFYIHWNQLRRDFSVIFVLATLGVLLSACTTATVGKPNPARHSLITTTVSRLVLRGRAPTGPAATQPGGPPNENILSLQSKRCIGRIIATKRAGFLFFAFEPPASWPRSIVSTSATAEGPGQSPNADGNGQRVDCRMSAAPQPASENSDCICWPPSKRLTDDVRMLYDVLVMLRDGAEATDEASAAEAFGLIADVVRIILKRQSSRN